MKTEEAGSAVRGCRPWLRTALALTLFMAFLQQPSASEAFRNVKEGDAVPAFSLPDLSGTAFNLADLAGKPKLIFVFSGNDRSKKVLNLAEPLYQKYKGDGLEVIAVYSSSDEAEAKSMAGESGATFPVLLDLKKEVYGQMGIFVTPVIAFVDGENKLAKEQGYIPLLEGILDIETRVLLGQLSREEADLALRPEEAPQASDEEKEAQKTYNLGLILLDRGMKDKAVEKFKKVLEIDPAFCEVRLQLGHIYLADDKADEAREQFTYVLKCDPRSHEAKVGMGTVYARSGELDKAVEILESSLMLNPRPELAYYELGKVHEEKGDLDKAVESYKKAIDRLLEK